jgi:hypothetical protein
MMTDSVQAQSNIRHLITAWLVERVPHGEWQWFQTALGDIGQSDRALFTTFSMLPRRFGKADAQLTAEDLAQAQALRPGWKPAHWSVDQLGRSLLLLSMPQENEAKVAHWFEQLYQTSGIRELVALHQTLPLLAHPERYRFWAAEGVRSHMTGVFEAIALNNPYPAEEFDEAAWNDLILKAIFIGAQLHPIVGLRQRANSQLSRMLVDYIAERQAAGRSISPELWLLVEPFLGYISPDRGKTVEIYRSQLPRGADVGPVVSSP